VFYVILSTIEDKVKGMPLMVIHLVKAFVIMVVRPQGDQLGNISFLLAFS
jgi:hypothetical protein